MESPGIAPGIHLKILPDSLTSHEFPSRNSSIDSSSDFFVISFGDSSISYGNSSRIPPGLSPRIPSTIPFAFPLGFPLGFLCDSFNLPCCDSSFTVFFGFLLGFFWDSPRYSSKYPIILPGFFLKCYLRFFQGFPPGFLLGLLHRFLP